MIHTESQAEFKPLSPSSNKEMNIREHSRIAAFKYGPNSQTGTLLDCTSPANQKIHNVEDQ